MGCLAYLYDLDFDPTDAANPRGVYSPYDFTSAGRAGIAKASMTRDWGRRESIMSIPELDGVLSGHGRRSGPAAARYATFGFTVWTTGDNDRAYDLLAAQVAPGVPQRLVYRTDGGTLRYTIGYDAAIKRTVTAADRWGGSGTGGQCDFQVTWRIRPYWTLHDPEAVPTTFSAARTEAFTAGNTLTFLNPGGVAIASAAQAFTMDATGTAGANLPTLPDNGPKFTFTGPCGGDSGLLVANQNVLVRDATNTPQQIYFTLPFKLPTSADSATLDFASQTFLHNGAPFRPIKPAYQREYFQVAQGIVNNCTASALGANPLSGGSLSRNFWRKFA